MRPMAEARKRSPGRTKRGRAGWITTGRRTAIWLVPTPKRSGPEAAFARILNTVMSSGSSTVTLVVPSGPTRMPGL